MAVLVPLHSLDIDQKVSGGIHIRPVVSTNLLDMLVRPMLNLTRPQLLGVD